MQTPLAIGATMMKKVDAALDEFGIPRRPIPTAFISKEYNEARQDIVALLELQALTKKKLFELQFYKKQLEAVTAESTDPADKTEMVGANTEEKTETEPSSCQPKGTTEVKPKNEQKASAEADVEMSEQTEPENAKPTQ